MQGLRIFSKSGSGITAEEVQAAHRVANTHREMKLGVVIVTDKATEILVEYYPFKNLCFTTPSSPIPLVFVYRMLGDYKELVSDGSYLMLPSYEKYIFDDGSTQIELYENKKRIRLDGLDKNGNSLPYNDLLNDSGNKANIIDFTVKSNQFFGLVDTNTSQDVISDQFNILVINDINAADDVANHEVITIHKPSVLSASAEGNLACAPLILRYFTNDALYIPLFYSYSEPPYDSYQESFTVYKVDLNSHEVDESSLLLSTDINHGPSTTIFGIIEQRSKASNDGLYTVANFFLIDLTTGISGFEVKVFKDAALLASFPLLIHPDDPATTGDDVHCIYAIDSSDSGNHYICAFSESDLSVAIGAPYEPNPYFYIVVDGVKETYTPVSHMTRVVDGIDYYENNNTFFETLLTMCPEDFGGNYGRLAIGESGRWCASLYSSGYSRTESDNTPIITTNIIHLINGVMVERVETVTDNTPGGIARDYILSATSSMNFSKAFVTPDDLYGVIFSPVFQNQDLGDDITSTDDGFYTNILSPNLLRISIYSLITNEILHEEVINSIVETKPGGEESFSIAADSNAPSRYRIKAKGAGYRLEISSDLYAYIDITPSDTGFNLSGIKLYSTIVNPNYLFYSFIPGIDSGNIQISPNYNIGKRRLSDFYE